MFGLLPACYRLKRRLRVAAALLAFSAFPAATAVAGEKGLYLIASDPYLASEPHPFHTYIRTWPKTSPAILYRLEDGHIRKVRTITTHWQDTLFVHPYPDQGYVLVGSIGAYEGCYLLDVLDLRSLAKEQAFDLDGCRNCYYVTSHLLKRDGRLIYMIRSSSYGENTGCACTDMGIDIRTGERIDGLGASDLKDAYVYGAPGGIVNGEVFRAPIRQVGRKAVLRGREDGEQHDLGWELPPGWALGEGATRLMVNNDHMRVLAGPDIRRPVPEWSFAARTFHVLDKVSGRWSALTLPGSGFPMEEYQRFSRPPPPEPFSPMRAYGPWLAAEEINVYTPEKLDLEALAEQRIAPFFPAAERFERWRAAPAGRFRLYNTRTGELIAHDTGEPNSEVLYVDGDDAVYYRVSDELRVARIENGGLERSQVLAKSPELWAVHWLVFGEE